MDRTLSNADKQASSLGQGFMRGFAKDVMGGRNSKKKKEAAGAAKASAEADEAAQFAAREAGRQAKVSVLMVHAADVECPVSFNTLAVSFNMFGSVLQHVGR